ncbi:anti-sigma factor [Telmatocola sphagniphila]|uniref:Anti-sigma factor n=1 Tax=Telmatocola sphagniphila TaxID=1123043 RepID=A0A8E6EXK3_9BACT|nr:anti-sigma factor [Telmatocola sphagniphila]QVL31718.1 anti-sigma factor [Telmatocola sphagniphila]
MNCQEVQVLLHPYSDDELDLVRHVEIEEHLSGCQECSVQVKHLQSLRATVSSASLYHRAPARLRARVQLPFPKQRRSPRRAVLAAGVLFLIGVSATVGMILSRTGTSADDRFAESVVAGHVRSLQVNHLTDMPSTDRHTVKPWFRGKLDFSPQVADLTPQGYSLAGGRLDYLTDRPVAALVYYRRFHVINLFTWPAGDENEKAVLGLARQGYNIRYWQRAGMSYWVISDLNEQELDDFVRLFQEHSEVLQR